MNCKKCGAEILEGQKFCSSCGARVEESLIHNAVKSEDNKAQGESVMVSNEVQAEKTEKVETKKKVCGFGIAGMVLGIVSICCDSSNYGSYIFTFITAILGLVFSCVSFKKFKSGAYKLKGFHIAGLVLSIISLSLLLISIIVAVIYNFYLSLGTDTTIFGSIL